MESKAHGDTLKRENLAQQVLRTELEATKRDLLKLKDKAQQIEDEREQAREDLQRMQAEKNAERTGKPLKQRSYRELEDEIRGLNNTIHVKNQQVKQMIALNPTTQAFEYIGPPVYLDVASGAPENSLNTVDKVVSAAKIWLKKSGNDRLTIPTAFSCFDMNEYGDIAKGQMDSGLARLGIKLRNDEWRLLGAAIESKADRDRFEYSVLVRELSGVPQNEFADAAILKFAKLAEKNDWSREAISKLIDEQGRGQLAPDAFKENIRGSELGFTSDEIKSMYNKSLRSPDARGIKTDDLVEHIMTSVKALLIATVGGKLFRPGNLTPAKLVKEYGKNGFLDQDGLKKALVENLYPVDQKPNMLKVLAFDLLDPQAKARGNVSKAKISVQTLKNIFEAGGV
jgi:hypothetical protein